MMAAAKAAPEDVGGAPATGSTKATLPVLDLVHLSHQTFGDEALEQDILQLFAKQASSTASALRATSDLRERARLYHLIQGSARGVGAFQVASLAKAAEEEPANTSHHDAVLQAIAEAAAHVGQLISGRAQPASG